MAVFGSMVAEFFKYSQKVGSNFAGPITPQVSVELMLKVVEGATVEKYGGSLVSQFGNKIWL
jgi:hypothetical protein